VLCLHVVIFIVVIELTICVRMLLFAVVSILLSVAWLVVVSMLAGVLVEGGFVVVFERSTSALTRGDRFNLRTIASHLSVVILLSVVDVFIVEVSVILDP